MKCLLILPRPVFPLVCGYALKNYNLIKMLAQTYDLKLVIISENDLTAQEESFYKELSVEYLCYKIPKWKSYANTLCGLFSQKPLQVAYYYDRNLQKQIQKWVSACDILVSALVRTREYLCVAESEKDKILVFDMVDSIALNYKRSKAKTKSLFWKILYSIEGDRLLRYEQQKIEKSNVTYLFNHDEVKYWEKFGNTKCLPHGVNSELFLYDKKDEHLSQSVVFIGKMDYQPNVDAAIWYIENVHSKIGQQVPFIIVGAYPIEKLYSYAEKYPNITITGFVDDPYIYASSSLAMVAPMQTGGGIQNKVLEGMALGKINIVSSLAAQPISGARDGEHFIVANTPDEYVDIILNLKENYEKYTQIGVQARKLILDTYTWENYGHEFISGLELQKIKV